MSLGPAGMVAVHAVCVIAAAAMVVQSRTTRTRVAHLVMLLAMVTMAVAGTTEVLVVTTVALAVTGAWLLRCQGEADAASCSLDLMTSAALVLLMGVGSVGRTSSGSQHHHGVGGHDMTGMTTASGSLPGVGFVVPVLALAVLAVWIGVRTRLHRGPGGAGRGAAVPAWSMIMAMCAMSLA